MTATESAVRELELPASLDIQHAAALHAQLVPELSVASLSLSAGAVDRVHTAGLQVLAAFVQTRSRAGHVTAWQSPSDSLRQAASRLGITALLGLPATAA